MAIVTAVSARRGHHFSKTNQLSVRLLAGLGVAGDGHAGERVKHRSRAMRDPAAPNLRQVHLIHEELFDELKGKGFAIGPGDIGENVTTRGSICWACRKARGCGWAMRRWWRSPGCVTLASRWTGSRRA